MTTIPILRYWQLQDPDEIRAALRNTKDGQRAMGIARMNGITEDDMVREVLKIGGHHDKITHPIT